MSSADGEVRSGAGGRGNGRFSLRDWLEVGLVLGLVGLIYGQLIGHDFVAWDDTSYVSQNVRVQQGLTWPNVIWAFASPHLSNWHPLTLISHMADVSLWGQRAGLHALTNAVLHAGNVLLVWLLMRSWLWRDTDTGKRQFLPVVVAVAFAIHPLHVESVAWISERKDVLCAFFFLLALWAYHQYVLRRSIAGYLRVTICVALALLAKPMAVSLPFVMLLLDVGLYRQWSTTGVSGQSVRWVEKTPWMLMAAGSAFMTVVAQTAAMPSFDVLERGLVVVSAYGWYLQKTFWPTELHFYYLTESAWSGPRAIFSIVIICGFSALAVVQRTRTPALWIGWLWFLLVLAPVVGVVKVGTQAWADRYAYLPHIGLFWAMGELVWYWRGRLKYVVLIVVAVLWTALATRQVGTWRNTETLYRHALNQDGGHYVAMMGMANEARRRNQFSEAERWAHLALERSSGPGLVRSMSALLGDLARQRGDHVLAQTHYLRGIAVDGQDPEIRKQLASLYFAGQRFREAEQQYREALRLDPDDPSAMAGVGAALGAQGLGGEAFRVLQGAATRYPHHRGVQLNFAAAAQQSNRPTEAIAIYRGWLARHPNDGAAANALQTLLTTSREN